MLKHISISNYILIEQLELDFSNGFSVVTGETGAGKSILIGALSLILGKRADTDVLLDKEKKCIIEGIFDIRGLTLESYFKENDLDYEEETVLRREINRQGKSRAFINDSPVTLPLIRMLGEKLVDIHSQHQTLLLNKTGFQMGVLDNFADNASLLGEYSASFQDLRQLRARLEELQDREEGMRAEEEYLNFQFDELRSAAIQEDEIRDLEAEIKLLSNAEEIKANIYAVNQDLSLSDSSILDRLRQAISSLEKISTFQDDIGSNRDRLESLLIELKDIAEGLDSIGNRVQHNPQRLEELTSRLDLIHSLLQKHKVLDVDALLTHFEEIGAKLDSISSIDSDIEKLKKQMLDAEAHTMKLTDELHTKRKESIPKIEEEISSSLTKLGMEEGILKIELTRLDDLIASGKDSISFTFSANRGSAPAAINRIASGGELSRLMLAIKSMITAKSLLPTIILDEIDMGVSGDIAAKVGSMLEDMSKKLQLVAITHLPQIAARADAHFNVYKKTAGNRTVSEVKCLTDGERIEEIAAMLSDENISSAAKQTAKELLGK